MHHSTLRALRVAVVGAAAACLALTGLVVSTGGAASAGTTPPPLDHFLCYTAPSVGFQPNANLLIKNAIQPAYFPPKILGVGTHCNPANKSVPVALFPAKNPLAHLYCWNIAYAAKPVRVNLSNQFGKAVMTTGPSPSKLCLPSWKSNIGPPNMAVNQPPRLDHFTCYPLVVVAGAYGFRFPSFVKAEDEFNAPNYTALKLGVANQLCVPTFKMAAGVVYAPQSANDLSLVCYPSSPTPYWKLIWDQNQFGTGRVTPNPRLEEFCVPTTALIG